MLNDFSGDAWQTAWLRMLDFDPGKILLQLKRNSVIGLLPIIFQRYVWWFSGNQNIIHGRCFLKISHNHKKRNYS
jgi:hypothetical protein